MKNIIYYFYIFFLFLPFAFAEDKAIPKSNAGKSQTVQSKSAHKLTADRSQPVQSKALDKSNAGKSQPVQSKALDKLNASKDQNLKSKNSTKDSFLQDESKSLIKESKPPFPDESKSPIKESKHPFQDRFTIDVESAFYLKKNTRLPKPYEWSVDYPEAEVFLFYPISKNSSFKVDLKFFYEDKHWDYLIRNLFVNYKPAFPLKIQLGYFEQPISYMSQNRLEFEKTLLMDKTLFPFQKSAVGALLESELKASFYLQASLQGWTLQRDIDFMRQPGINPALTASLIYRSQKQKAFLSYFQQSLGLNNKDESLGLGFDLLYPKDSFKIRLRGELWKIKRDLSQQDVNNLYALSLDVQGGLKPVYSSQEKMVSFYVFPSLRWNRFYLGALLGGLYHDLTKPKNLSLESILTGRFYLKENLFFTVERVKEWNQLVRENYWSFYLTSEFDIY